MLNINKNPMGGGNLPSKNKSYKNFNLFKSLKFVIATVAVLCISGGDVFAKTCESVLKDKEEFKKDLMERYAKSWDEIVKLAKGFKLKTLAKNKIDRGRIMTVEQRVRDIVFCENDPHYLDD